jgi:hypothetical protein
MAKRNRNGHVGKPRGITKRDLLKGGGAGLASAVVLGSGVVRAPASAAAPAS